MVDFMLCLGRKSKRRRSQESDEMLVSECSLFASKTIKICVISAEGIDWHIDVTSDFSAEKVKLMALGHFYNPVETIKAAAQYKLVLVPKRKRLHDERTLIEQGVKDNDELLLLRRRSKNGSHVDGSTCTSEEKDQAGDMDEALIQQRTSHLIPKNEHRTSDDSITVVDFQTELRKILISLIDAAQKIQQHDANALPILRTDQVSEIKASDKRLEGIDPGTIKQLTDMGFSERKTVRALKESGMLPIQAMEWLLQNQNEVDDHELTEESTIDNQEPQTSTPSPHNISVAQLLEAFKAYKRKEFRPNVRALNNLKEMGFPEDKIVDALRVAGNNQDAACDWLLGDRSPSAEDLNQGLETEGPIYKAIMANPIVQLGLGNPKTLLAFLHMLENPNSCSHWLNDPDTAPLLSQIFKIYHAEKHSLQIRASNIGSS